MAFEPGSERGHKLRMVWIALDEEGDRRVGEATAKRVGREVEVWRYGRRWAELASVVSAATGLAEEAWEEGQFGERRV